MPDIKTIADRADVIVNCYSKLTEGGSAKFFVKSNGDSVVRNRGILNDREIAKISAFIKDHYQEMYLRWSQYSDKGYYEK